MNFFKKLAKLKLKAWMRIALLSITLVGAGCAIVFGAKNYTAKNVHKSVEYGGGAEYLVQIQPLPGASQVKPDEIANEIYNRVDSLGIAGVKVATESHDSDYFVRVTYPGAVSKEQINDIEKEITQKPKLTFTDIYGNPLFGRNGNFDTRLTSGVTGPIVPIENIKWNENSTPIVPSSAHYVDENGDSEVAISIQTSKQFDWYQATSYISGLGTDKNKIIAWLNIDDYISKLKNTYVASNESLWDNAKHDPYAAAHHGNNIKAGLRNSPDVLFPNASSYMISDASVEKPMFSADFVIKGNFSKIEATELAKKINFGAAGYKLETKFKSQVDASYGNDAFKKAIIAAIVVFSVIAIFLIFNYGLLGALSTISIALFVFITLTLFTVMRGEYSPESIAALIIGIGMSVDANIITFERFKNELYAGSSVAKAERISTRKSFWTIFDANITTLIIAVVLFYFGTRNIVGLSITLMLSILLTLVIMLGFTKVTTMLLLRTGWFEKRQYLVGIKPKIDVPIQKAFNKVDYMRYSKWFLLFSFIVIAAGAITMGIIAGVAHNFAAGFNVSSDFKAGATYQFQVDQSNPGSNLGLDTINRVLKESGITNITYSYDNNGTITAVKALSDSGTISTQISQWQSGLTPIQNEHFNFLINSTTAAQQLIKEALIAIGISIAGITLYCLIRFRWTYAIAAIIALLHDGIIVIAVFAFTRVQISPVFVAGLLSILGYSINDTIVTFDRLREKMSAHHGKLGKAEIKQIANQAIADTIKRSLLTSLTTIIAVAVLMCFGNATKIEFNFAMLIGLVFGTYSSIVVATYLWTKLEYVRQCGIQRRTKNKFWECHKIEEQTVAGLNDFKI